MREYATIQLLLPWAARAFIDVHVCAQSVNDIHEHILIRM